MPVTGRLIRGLSEKQRLLLLDELTGSNIKGLWGAAGALYRATPSDWNFVRAGWDLSDDFSSDADQVSGHEAPATITILQPAHLHQAPMRLLRAAPAKHDAITMYPPL
jgi:hypothetical protein